MKLGPRVRTPSPSQGERRGEGRTHKPLQIFTLTQPSPPRGRGLYTRSFAEITAFAGCALLVLSIGVGAALGDPGAPGPELNAADLSRRVDALGQRVDELASDGPGAPGLDSLYFGWFDRPYARATLATLVKASAVLQREVRLRKAGNGAIPAPTLGAMLHWAEDAIDRVLADEPDPRFRPHRVRVTANDIADGSAPPLFAFLDRASATRLHPVFGDLDLLAAVGQRVYVRDATDPADAANLKTLIRRAEFLGITVVDVLPKRGASETAIPAPTTPIANLLRVQPLTILDLLTSMAPGSKTDYPAIADPIGGEYWPSRVARRALPRGVFGSRRCAVCSWNADSINRSPAESGRSAAALWVDVLEGVSLAVADGWRDLRDGSGSASPSIMTRPDEIESLARTSLDLLRFVDSIRSFENARPVLIAVPMEAVDDLDPNKWAGWIEPFFAALVGRQIAFDVVAEASNRKLSGSRYPVVFPLKRADTENLNMTIVRLERELAAVEGFANRQTVRTLDGSFPPDLYVRAGGLGDRIDQIAVVNLSGSSRELKLTGGASVRLRDVLSGTLTIGRDGQFTIGPWQACLFRPR